MPSTRKLTYGAAASLDGYIAGPGESLDWLRWSDEVASITSAFWATIDTVLMGSKTYANARRAGPVGYPGKQTFVFSRTQTVEESEELSWVREDAVEFVRRLKAAPGGGICLMGGGALAAPLLDAGLVDEVGVNWHPLLLGSGTPLFPETRGRLDLHLVESRALHNGCVYSLYRAAS